MLWISLSVSVEWVLIFFGTVLQLTDIKGSDLPYAKFQLTPSMTYAEHLRQFCLKLISVSNFKECELGYCRVFRVYCHNNGDSDCSWKNFMSMSNIKIWKIIPTSPLPLFLIDRLSVYIGNDGSFLIPHSSKKELATLLTLNKSEAKAWPQGEGSEVVW